MSKILGKNVILYIVTNASPEIRTPIGCARTCTLNTNMNIAGKSTIGSGKWQEFKGLSLSWTCSVDGLCTIDQNLGISDLRQLQFSLQSVYIYFESDISNVYSGYGLITSVNENGPYADMSNYSVQIQGSGQLNIDYGNYPLLFQIRAVSPDDPIVGETTLSLVWNPATPTPNFYKVKILDFTSRTTTYSSNIPEIGHTVNIVVDSSHSYSFAIQSNYIGYGNSIYSPQIYFDPPLLIDSDGDFIIDSNNDFILI